jgi:hypothetical protein
MVLMRCQSNTGVNQYLFEASSDQNDVAEELNFFDDNKEHLIATLAHRVSILVDEKRALVQANERLVEENKELLARLKRYE